MEILYENDKLAIKWEYKITRHTHDSKLSRTTQHITGLSTALVNLAGIRQVLFLYKNPITNEYGLTTTEPPIEEYHTILTRTNHDQVTIQLPRELNLKEKEQQNIIITYYPHEEDPYLKTKPYITIQIIDVETNESKAELVKIDDKTKLLWVIEPHENIPADLEQFLTADEIERLKYPATKQIVELDVQSLNVKIEVENEKKTNTPN